MSVVLDPNKLSSHISFTSTDLIKQVADPFLEKHNLTYFAHGRNFTDGGLYAMSTLPELYQNVFKHKLYTLMKSHHALRPYDSRALLWSGLSEEESKIIHFAREHHNIDNGITIVRNYPYHQDHYHFAAAPNNVSAYNFYINHFDKLNTFIDSYENKFSAQIKKCDNQRLVMPYCDAPNIAFREQVETIENQIAREQYFLTSREIECLNWTAKNKIAEEVAQIINRTKRTVDFHLSNVNHKLGTKNKYQAVVKALELGIIKA